jgi:hypothetical protein
MYRRTPPSPAFITNACQGGGTVTTNGSIEVFAAKEENGMWPKRKKYDFET